MITYFICHIITSQEVLVVFEIIRAEILKKLPKYCDNQSFKSVTICRKQAAAVIMPNKGVSRWWSATL